MKVLKMSKPVTDLTGKQFNRLTVIRRSDRRIGGHIAWVCKCSCGSVHELVVRGNNLTNGQAKSCGCIRSRNSEALRTARIEAAADLHHGHAANNGHTKVYRTWLNMRERCGNPNNNQYHRYGGRGIGICARWDLFQNFLADMGEPPSALHSIERKRSDEDYSPDNCRWATATEQANNRSTNRYLSYLGRTQTLAQWGRELEVDPKTIYNRLRYGWSDEEALQGHRNGLPPGRKRASPQRQVD
jgi:hypothetical protein